MLGGGVDLIASSEDNASEDLNPYKTEYTQPGEGAAEAETIAIPAGIESIDPAFFQLFPNLISISVSDDNESYSSYNGILFDAAQSNLLLVPEGMEGNAVLPESIATVPAYAFSRCTKLSAISLTGSTGASFITQDGILYSADGTQLAAAPAGIGSTVAIAAGCAGIAEGAFYGNGNLKTIVANGFVQGIAKDAFSQRAVENATVAINVDADSRDAAREIWEAAGFTKFADPAVPGAIIEPAEGSGFAFVLLDDYTLSVRWMGSEPAPAKLEVPLYGILNGVQYKVSAIAAEGFAGQTEIQQVVLPEGLAVIGDAAFKGDTELNTINVPGSVTAIGAKVFSGCDNLVALTLNEGLAIIGDAAFEGIAQTAIVLPASVKAVGDYAFANSPNLKMIVALGTVDEVGSNALGSATGLKLYVPYNEDDTYAWTAGLPAAGNHLMPYGVKLTDETINVSTDDEPVSLFTGGYLKAPEGFEVNYAYKANPISISDEGMVKAKDNGTSNVEVELSLDVPVQVVNGITSKSARLTPAAFLVADESEVSEAPDVVEIVMPVTMYAATAVSSVLPNTTTTITRDNSFSTTGTTVKFTSPRDGYGLAYRVVQYKAGTQTLYNFTIYNSRYINYRSEDHQIEMEGTLNGVSSTWYITYPSDDVIGWSLDGGMTCATKVEIENIATNLKTITAFNLASTTVSGNTVTVHVPNKGADYRMMGSFGGSLSRVITSDKAVTVVPKNDLSGGYSFRITDYGELITSGSSPTHGASTTTNYETIRIQANDTSALKSCKGYVIKGSTEILKPGLYRNLEPIELEAQIVCEYPSASNTATTSANQLSVTASNNFTLRGARTTLADSYNGAATAPADGGSWTIQYSNSKNYQYVTAFSVNEAGVLTFVGKAQGASAATAFSAYTVTPTPPTGKDFTHWGMSLQGVGGLTQIIKPGITYYCPPNVRVSLIPNATSFNVQNVKDTKITMKKGVAGELVAVDEEGNRRAVSASTDDAVITIKAAELTVNSDKSLSFFGWAWGDTTSKPQQWTISCTSSSWIGFGIGYSISPIDKGSYMEAVESGLLRAGMTYKVSDSGLGSRLYTQHNRTKITFRYNETSYGALLNTPTTSLTAELGQSYTITIPKVLGHLYSHCVYYTDSNGRNDNFFPRKTDDYSSYTSLPTTWEWTCGAVELTFRLYPISAYVYFEPNGGTGIMSYRYYTYTNNGALPKNTFTRSNWHFDGWATSQEHADDGIVDYEDQDIITDYMAKFEPVDDLHLYAVWTPTVDYAILEFLGNGNTGGEMSKQVILITDEDKTSKPNEFTRDYYTFNGWRDAANGTPYDDPYTVMFPWDSGQTIRLKAQWWSNRTYFTFAKNDGSEYVYRDYHSAAYGESYTFPTLGFEWEGHTQIGWSTEPDGEKEWELDGSDFDHNKLVSKTEFETETTLYAVWEASKERTLTVNVYLENADDNDYMLGKTITKDCVVGDVFTVDALTEDQVPSFYHHNTELGDQGPITITEDQDPEVDIYFSRDLYQLSYEFSGEHPNDMTPPSGASVKWGATVQLPWVEEPDQYAFLGWSVNGNPDLIADGTFVMPTQATTVTGAWSYTAYFTVEYSKGATSGAYGQAPVDGASYKNDDQITLAGNDPDNDAGWFRSNYIFLGWSHVDGDVAPEFKAGEQTTLGHLVNGDKVTLYAVWGPQVNVESPLTPTITVMVDRDGAGISSTKASANAFASSTPEPVLVSSMKCEPVEGENGTIKVLPHADEWGNFEIEMTANNGDQRMYLPIAQGGSLHNITMADEARYKFIIPAASSGTNGRLPVTFDLVTDLTEKHIVAGLDDVPIAKLKFTFQLAKEVAQLQ